MALYVVDINEKSEKGKQFKNLLRKNQPAMKFYTLSEYEKQEEIALMKIMSKSAKEELVSATEVKSTLAKIKKRLAK